MIRKRVRIGLLFCICIICILHPVSVIAQTKPSPKILIDSWQKMCTSLKQNIHSYRLSGSSSVRLNTKPDLANHVLREVKVTSQITWIAIYDDAKFRYECTQTAPEYMYQSLTFDGKQWNDLHNSGHNYGYGGDIFYRPASWSKISPTAIYKSSMAWPFDLNYTLSDPTETRSETIIAAKYNNVLQYMNVTGPENINGQRCYHLHLPLKYSSMIPVGAPCDIWIAIMNNKYVPWQFQVYYGANGRSTFSFLNGEWYKDVWFPTDISIIGELQDLNKVWFPISSSHIHLSVTNINEHFDDSVFRINFPPGTQVSVQKGTTSVFEKTYRVTYPHKNIPGKKGFSLWLTIIFRNILPILLLLIFVVIVRYALCRRKNPISGA